MLPYKVCCMLSADEADMAIAAGARAIGLVGEMPNGPGPIDDELIRDIVLHVHQKHGNRAWTTLLTSRIEGDAIADHIAYTGANTIQIVDAPAPQAHAIVRRAHKAIRIFQVIHVEDEGAIEDARKAAETADFILLDSGKPSAKNPTLGGTGDVHDWSISRQIVEAVDKPVFLAGGLDPHNVAEAVALVKPYGVDICSGLRDKKDGYKLLEDKLSKFSQQLSMVA